MAGRPYRIGIVGAASLAGKELSEALAESSLAACDVVLLDAEDAAGQVTAAGDEAAFIQKIDADSFAGLDFIFFAGDPGTATKYWKIAKLAGASIVDMTYALESEAGVVVRGPWAGLSAAAPAEGRLDSRGPDLTTAAVVAAHPVALMLLLVANRIHAKFPARAISATVFEPASEHGRAAMDELHQQTVSLLSFQSLPREQYDAQVAFNLLPALGDAAKVNLAAIAHRISHHYTTLSAGAAPKLALQLIQAPVFHGYAASVLVELQGAASLEQIELAAYGEHVDLLGPESDPPSNLSAAGQPDILIQVSAAAPAAAVGAAPGAAPIAAPAAAPTAAVDVGVGESPASRFWLWLAVDNLKLSALNAIACASELRRLRPQGTVQ